jgi:hypothetical protein
MLNGVTYRKVDDAGLHITVGGADITIPADTVVVCAGQDPQRELQADLKSELGAEASLATLCAACGELKRTRKKRRSSRPSRIAPMS